MEQLIENILFEVDYRGIVRKQKSISRLFPEFGDRVKQIGKKGGLRLLEQKPDEWVFKIHSGTSDVWYENHLKFKNMEESLRKAVYDKRNWISDKSRVNRSKLARYMLYRVDLELSCSCPAQKYYGGDYILSLSKYDAKYGDKEDRAPRKKNPKQYGMICKHLQNLINVLPFYESTFAKWLTKFYDDDIKKMEEVARSELGFAKKAEEKPSEEKPAEEPQVLREPEQAEEPVEKPEPVVKKVAMKHVEKLVVEPIIKPKEEEEEPSEKEIDKKVEPTKKEEVSGDKTVTKIKKDQTDTDTVAPELEDEKPVDFHEDIPLPKPEDVQEPTEEELEEEDEEETEEDKKKEDEEEETETNERINESINERKGFVWANGKIDFFDEMEEHEILIDTIFAGKPIPYIAFIEDNDTLGIRIDHELSMKEILAISSLIKKSGYRALDVDIQYPESNTIADSFVIVPIRRNWATRINNRFRQITESIDESIEGRKGFVWADGKRSFFSEMEEHDDLINTVYADKPRPYIEFIEDNDELGIRIDHELSLKEIRALNSLMSQNIYQSLYVDIWSATKSYEEIEVLEISPITRNWATRVNNKFRQVSNITESIVERKGFVWANGKIDFFSEWSEHADLIDTRFKNKPRPFVTFLSDDDTLGIRINHKLSTKEALAISSLIRKYGYQALDVDISYPDSTTLAGSFVIVPIRRNWATLINNRFKKLVETNESITEDIDGVSQLDAKILGLLPSYGGSAGILASDLWLETKGLLSTLGKTKQTIELRSRLNSMKRRGLVSTFIGTNRHGKEVRKYEKAEVNEARMSDVAAEIENKWEAIGVELTVFESDKFVNIAAIHVPKHLRKQGIGTKIMTELTSYADSVSKTMSVSPAARGFDGSTSRSRLVKFYKRFGFIENKGKAADNSITNTMYRLPITEGIECRLGDCYRLSGRYVMANHNATLVHGTVNGKRWSGRDFDNPHAWVEEGDEVYDAVWDKRFDVEAYYKIMNAKVIKKYDWEKASIAMLKAEHWGPWHEEVDESMNESTEAAVGFIWNDGTVGTFSIHKEHREVVDTMSVGKLGSFIEFISGDYYLDMRVFDKLSMAQITSVNELVSSKNQSAMNVDIFIDDSSNHYEALTFRPPTKFWATHVNNVVDFMNGKKPGYVIPDSIQHFPTNELVVEEINKIIPQKSSQASIVDTCKDTAEELKIRENIIDTQWQKAGRKTHILRYGKYQITLRPNRSISNDNVDYTVFVEEAWPGEKSVWKKVETIENVGSLTHAKKVAETWLKDNVITE